MTHFTHQYDSFYFIHPPFPRPQCHANSKHTEPFFNILAVKTRDNRHKFLLMTLIFRIFALSF